MSKSEFSKPEFNMGEEIFFYNPMPGLPYPKSWNRLLNRCGVVLSYDPIGKVYTIRLHVSGRRCGRRKKRVIRVHAEWLRRPDLIEKIGSL